MTFVVYHTRSWKSAKNLIRKFSDFSKNSGNSVSRVVFIPRTLPFGRPNSLTFKIKIAFHDHKEIK